MNQLQNQTVKKKVGRPKKIEETTISLNNNVAVQEQKKEPNIVLFIPLVESDIGDENEQFEYQKKESAHDKIAQSTIMNSVIDESYESEETPIIVKKKTVKSDQKNQYNYHCVQIVDKEGDKFKPCVTDCRCWWCDESFDNIPAYLVNSYRDGNYYIFGNFCSFNCAVTYNLRSLKDFKCNTRHALTCKLRTQITGENNIIKFAGERELLKSKGGIMEIDEYRDGFSRIKTEMRMNIPPIIPLVHIVDQKNRATY